MYVREKLMSYQWDIEQHCSTFYGLEKQLAERYSMRNRAGNDCTSKVVYTALSK